MRNKILTQEHKKNISNSHKENYKKGYINPMKGKNRIAWNKGLTKETDGRLKKQSGVMKGRIFGKRREKGFHISEEQKEKISLKLKGRKVWNKGLTKETDVRLKEYGEKVKKNAKINKNYGMRNKSCSELHKQRIGLANKGHLVLIETRMKIKEARANQILPVKDTSIEIKIQNFLKQLNIEFLTHQYMNIENGYQCDILIPSMNMIIECYGDYWHKIPYGNPVDALRCQELRGNGVKVKVFWEREIKAMELNDFEKEIYEN